MGRQEPQYIDAVTPYGKRTRRLPVPPHVVLELADAGGETALTFTLLADGDMPDESKTGHIRRRINQLLFADLRSSYGQ